MKKTLLAGLATGLLLMGMAGMAQAVPYGFTEITTNSSIDVSSQLSVDVSNDSGLTLFTFTNSGALRSSICDIYFDWGTGTALTYESSIDSGSGVAFTPGANPSNLPGGNGISFTADWSTDSDSPTQPNGISNYNGAGTQESLTVKFSGLATDSILGLLDNGTYRIGLHIQGLADGESESYVTGGAPVPEPATMLLLGTGLAGLAGARRRRKA